MRHRERTHAHRQVIQNIIANAIEYSPRGGTVAVRLARVGGACVLTCEDHGIGIPEADQAKVFQRFFRASNAQEAKLDGSGLGLYIAKTICDELGFDISFKSTVGQGSEFTVTFH